MDVVSTQSRENVFNVCYVFVCTQCWWKFWHVNTKTDASIMMGFDLPFDSVSFSLCCLCWMDYLNCRCLILQNWYIKQKTNLYLLSLTLLAFNHYEDFPLQCQRVSEASDIPDKKLNLSHGIIQNEFRVQMRFSDSERTWSDIVMLTNVDFDRDSH